MTGATPLRHGMEISLQAFSRLSRLQQRISWRILPMPFASAVFDQLVIDGRAIRPEHIGHGAPVLVLAERLERDTTVTERIDGQNR